MYLRHAICQCHGDTSGEEDKYRPHCVAVYRWIWHTQVDHTLYKVLGLRYSEVELRECWHHCQQDVFSPSFTYRIFLLENVHPFLWAGLNFPSRISPSVFNLMQLLYHIFC